MKKHEVVQTLLKDRTMSPIQVSASAFAPTNIALIKYWGKRDAELHLPETSSVSLTLPEWGAHTTLKPSETWSMTVNGERAAPHVLQRVVAYCDLFQLPHALEVATTHTLPMAAGLASSASGFAALVAALNELYGWALDQTSLSILARLGSGSACRSLWHGFVQWERGRDPNGWDSHGVPRSTVLPDLCLGIQIVSSTQKPMDSRHAMEHTRLTSAYYHFWPAIVQQDLEAFDRALPDFERLGPVIERHALAMHWTMHTSMPPVFYAYPETIETIRHVYQLRQEGTQVYYTQDAGPNLKILFLEQDMPKVLEHFPNLLISKPFS